MATKSASVLIKHLKMSSVDYFMASEAYLGYCVKCHAEHGECEPDTRARRCEACGEWTVYGAEEWMTRGWIDLTDPDEPEDRPAERNQPPERPGSIRIPRAVFELHHYTDESTRYTGLNSIELSAASGRLTAVATDGVALAHWRISDAWTGSDFRVYIPARVAKAFLPTSRRSRAHADVIVDIDKTGIVVSGRTNHRYTFPLDQDFRYPAYRAVIRGAAGDEWRPGTPQLSVTSMARLAASFQAFSTDPEAICPDAWVPIEKPETKPAVFTFPGSDGLIVLMMPVTNKQQPIAPAFPVL